MDFCLKGRHHNHNLICMMLLHYYTPTVSPYHHGHGFGSIFAKIFSKVAAKTAAKTALNVAKTAGKKALSVAAKKGAEIAKEVAKEGLKQAADLGTELAKEKIKDLTETALKTKLPPEIVHSVQSLATKGVDAAGSKVKTLDVDSLIDKGVSRAEHLGNRLIDKGVDRGNRLIGHEPSPRKRKKSGNSQSPARKRKKAARDSQLLTNILAGYE